MASAERDGFVSGLLRAESSVCLRDASSLKQSFDAMLPTIFGAVIRHKDAGWQPALREWLAA